MTPSTAEFASWSRRDGLLLFAVAFVLRLAHVLASKGDPVFDVPMLDAEYLVDWARSIAAGDLVGSPEGAAYFRTPLYPFFLAAIFRLPGDDFLMARLAQAVVGAFIPVFVATVAARRFGRVAAWSAGLLAATAWPLLHYGRELLLTVVAVFLVALLVAVWDRTTPQARSRRWFGLGVLAACAALAWSSLAVLAPVVALGAAAEPAPNRAVRGRRALAVLAGFALIVAPVAVRNFLVSGEPVLLSTQGGINLWIGNNPEADGMSARLPGFSSWRNEDVDAALAREYGRPVGAREQDAIFRAKAFDFFRNEPAAAARLFAKKAYYFLQGYEIRNDRDLDSLRERSPILRLPLPDFGWIGPLAIAGLFFARRRLRSAAHLAAAAAAIAVVVVLFFVCARYRMAAWPPLLVFAGAGVAGLLERGLALPVRIARIALVVALVALARIDFLDIRRPDPSQPHFQYGNVYARVGRSDDAEREFRTALSIAPAFGEARHHLGALLLEEGRVPEAVDELRESVRLLPASFRARRSLADALEASGRLEEALVVRNEVATMTSGDPEDVHALARALGAVGRYDEAWGLFDRLVADRDAAGRPDDPWLLLNAGQTALRLGEERRGLALIERAQAYEPTLESALEAKALYLLATRRWTEALHFLSDSLLRHPDNLRLVKMRAAARYTTGDATGAIEDLERVLSMDPEDAEARRRLDEVRGIVPGTSP